MLLNFKQLSADVYYIREISQGQIKKLEINDGSKIDIDIKLMIKICENADSAQQGVGLYSFADRKSTRLNSSQR